MKKTVRFLVAIVLLILLTSCQIIIDDLISGSPITVYNNTNESIYSLKAKKNGYETIELLPHTTLEPDTDTKIITDVRGYTLYAYDEYNNFITSEYIYSYTYLYSLE